MNGSSGIFIHHEVLGISQMQEYLGQFIRSIVIEMDGLGETTLQSGIGVYEVMHLVSIACHDTDELAPIVFQTLQ